MDWIKVNEQLPKKDVEISVEVILENGNIIEGRYHNDYWMYDPKWDYDDNTVSKVKYWRPLIERETIDIEGIDYEIPKPVWDLIITISKERDHYKSVFDGSGN